MTATDATNGSPQDAEELRRQLETHIQASVADLQYLKQSRDVLLTHPSRVFAIDRDAASCRVALVGVVTAIDRTLELWQGADFLHEYEQSGKSNGDKIRALERCFSASSVQDCSAAVEDYLAIKYLRNAVVHVKLPTPEQAAHIKSRNFPVEPRNLNSQDWDRIVATAAQILRYISQAALHTGEKMFDERFILTTDLQ